MHFFHAILLVDLWIKSFEGNGGDFLGVTVEIQQDDELSEKSRLH